MPEEATFKTTKSYFLKQTLIKVLQWNIYVPWFNVRKHVLQTFLTVVFILKR